MQDNNQQGKGTSLSDSDPKVIGPAPGFPSSPDQPVINSNQDIISENEDYEEEYDDEAYYDDDPIVTMQSDSKKDGIKSIISTVLILILAPILALSITAFVFQSYEVDGPSMESTLQDKDRLIVWKAGRTWSRVTKSSYIPPRGTVVIFTARGLYDAGSGKDKQLVKRIIGVPGDRVVVENNTVTVYNHEFPNGFRPDEAMDYGKNLKGENIGNTSVDVHENEVFVMGDHRDNSLDSRSFGSVPYTDIVGTLSARILPLSEAKKF